MIELNNITKIFVSNKKYPGFLGTLKGLFSNEKIVKRAISDISFKINEGEIVGYIGTNGAGKSTTIKIMTGIMNPTAGKCIVNGIEPYKKRKKNAANIGVVFGQRTQLWWDLPVCESYTILKEIYGISNEQYNKQIQFLNEVLELDSFWNTPVRVLSLGQKMRADLGAALLHNPKILYLDEPTIGLDVVVKDKIRTAIKEINKKYNTTIILTTHDMGDIEELCQRIIVIDDGKKIFDDSIEKMKFLYGSNRMVCFKIIDFNKLGFEDIKKLFNDENIRVYIDAEQSELSILYNQNINNTAEIVDKILCNLDVDDIRFEEIELEDIVKMIYRREKVFNI